MLKSDDKKSNKEMENYIKQLNDGSLAFVYNGETIKVLNNKEANLFLEMYFIPINRKLFTLYYKTAVYSLLEYCCIVCDTSIEELRTGSRIGKVTDAKRIFCALMRKHTTLSFSKIGKFLHTKTSHNGTDHATVIYMIRTCEEYLETNKTFLYKYLKVKEALNNKMIYIEQEPKKWNYL